MVSLPVAGEGTQKARGDHHGLAVQVISLADVLAEPRRVEHGRVSPPESWRTRRGRQACRTRVAGCHTSTDPVYEGTASPARLRPRRTRREPTLRPDAEGFAQAGRARYPSRAGRRHWRRLRRHSGRGVVLCCGRSPARRGAECSNAPTSTRLPPVGDELRPFRSRRPSTPEALRGRRRGWPEPSDAPPSPRFHPRSAQLGIDRR